MPQVSNYSSRRHFPAVSLLGVSSLIPTLTAAVLLWGVGAIASLDSASGQVQPAPIEPEPGSTQQLLEEARRRLLEGNETSQTDSVADPTAGTDQLSPQFDTYRLGPGDSFFANIPLYPDLSFQGTLDLQGNVVVPLAGTLPMEGLSLDEARQQIQVALNRFVVNPQVELTLVAQRPVQVSIYGEVTRPGLYPLAAPQLATALLSAGGVTRLADLRTVRIRRYLTDGSVIEQNVDLYTPLREFGALPDVRLADGDAIVIPTLTADDVQNYDRNLIARSTLATQQIVIRVLNYSGGGRSAPGTINNITLPNGSNFLDAITTVGVSPSTSRLGDIALIRFDPRQGKAVSQELDAKDAILGDTTQNPPLENNDVIVIGRNFVSRITYALSTFTQPFRDVLGFLLFFDELADSASDIFGPGGDDDN